MFNLKEETKKEKFDPNFALINKEQKNDGIENVIELITNIQELQTNYYDENLNALFETNRLLSNIIFELQNKEQIHYDYTGIGSREKQIAKALPDSIKDGYIGALIALSTNLFGQEQKQEDNKDTSDFTEELQPNTVEKEEITKINNISNNQVLLPKDLKIKAKNILFSSEKFIIEGEPTMRVAPRRRQGGQTPPPAAAPRTGTNPQAQPASFRTEYDSALPPLQQLTQTQSDSASPMQSPGLTDGDIIVPVSGPISSPFGQRARGFHEGIDFAIPVGTPIRASTSGTVSFAGERGNYGNLIIIKDQNGLETRYAHLSDINVARGDSVTAGQVIAKSGNTGLSTGPHLHFETRQAGQPVDPQRFLTAAAPVLPESQQIPGEPTGSTGMRSTAPAETATQTQTTAQPTSDVATITPTNNPTGSILGAESTAQLVAESTPPQITVETQPESNPIESPFEISSSSIIDPNNPGTVGISPEDFDQFYGDA